MNDTPPVNALFQRRQRASRPSRGSLSGDLSPQLLAEATKRLRVMALVFSFTFFMADYFPVLIDAERRSWYFANPSHWLPGGLSIAIGLLVFAVTLLRIAPATTTVIGLAFEVIGSFGIAAAQYHDIVAPIVNRPESYGGFGLSWVAVWVLLFTIAVPTPPRRALVATLLSVSAVPIVFRIAQVSGTIAVHPTPLEYFFSLIFPYLLVVMLTYVGARVVYRLGREVTRAQELGSYQLVELLGRGGMGEVWRARHRLLARPAAVKLIRGEVLGQGDAARHAVAQARFEREAQATAAMHSPHTISLYDYGVSDDGTFYYVMELLDGFDLESLVQRFGPLSAERAVYLLRQVCHSLAEAHESGLIHRDLKPANVYVCRYGRDLDFVKVLDFGLVKAQGDGQSTDLKLTAENAVGGTPAFMAPEQALGNRPVDAQSDLYGAGCLAYWMLTGRLVFEGRTAMDTMMQHIHATPVPPSERTELAVPPALNQVILSCLAKDTAERPPSAVALQEALEAVSLAEHWTTERAERWWNRHRPSGAVQAAAIFAGT